MLRTLTVSLLLLAVCGPVVAADYIRLDVDTLYENQTSDWEFYLLRECPTPEKIMGVMNAWQLNAVGNATWDFYGGITRCSDHHEIFALGGLLFTDGISGTGMTEGEFVVGGAGMPPGGLPIITTEKFWFSLEMTMGDLPPGSTGDGVLIDSLHFAGMA